MTEKEKIQKRIDSLDNRFICLSAKGRMGLEDDILGAMVIKIMILRYSLMLSSLLRSIGLSRYDPATK